MNDERKIRAALTMLGDAGNERIGADVAEHGFDEALQRWLAGHGPKNFKDRFNSALEKVDAQFAQLPQLNARFIIPSDLEWPEQLDDLEFGAPLGLWIRGNGNVRELSHRMLAIVGARAATSYGERIASDLAAQAAGRGIATISGAAYGIDAAAHRGSLAGGGTTVAVLACGIDVAYPAAHAGLLDRIALDGVIVSEAALTTSPHKRHFLVRNRLIACLSSSTVVVEAALRSGSLSTGNWAAAIGRDVWGVPGPITSATSAGVHVAIKDGVMQLMSSNDDVLAKYPSESTPSLGFIEDLVMQVLYQGPASVERIAQVCADHCSAADVQAVLTLLEITGRAANRHQGWTLV